MSLRAPRTLACSPVSPPQPSSAPPPWLPEQQPRALPSLAPPSCFSRKGVQPLGHPSQPPRSASRQLPNPHTQPATLGSPALCLGCPFGQGCLPLPCLVDVHFLPDPQAASEILPASSPVALGPFSPAELGPPSSVLCKHFWWGWHGEVVQIQGAILCGLG